MGFWTTDLWIGKHPLYRLSHQPCRIADTSSLQGLECVLFLAWFVRQTTASWISFKLWNSFTFLRLKQIWYGDREERGPSLSTVLEHSRQKNNRWLKLLLWGYWSVFLIMGAGNTDVLKNFILHFLIKSEARTNEDLHNSLARTRMRNMIKIIPCRSLFSFLLCRKGRESNRKRWVLKPQAMTNASFL